MGNFPLRVRVREFPSILENIEEVIFPGLHFKLPFVGLVFISRPWRLSWELLLWSDKLWLMILKVLRIIAHTSLCSWLPWLLPNPGLHCKCSLDEVMKMNVLYYMWTYLSCLHHIQLSEPLLISLPSGLLLSYLQKGTN